MHSRGMKPVYLTIDKMCDVKRSFITGEELFGMDPLSDNLFYGFEQTYQPFAKYYTGKSERIDLVLSNNDDNIAIERIGGEVDSVARQHY